MVGSISGSHMAQQLSQVVNNNTAATKAPEGSPSEEANESMAEKLASSTGHDGIILFAEQTLYMRLLI